MQHPLLNMDGNLASIERVIYPVNVNEIESGWKDTRTNY
jgi:hypothetical protein